MENNNQYQYNQQNNNQYQNFNNQNNQQMNQNNIQNLNKKRKYMYIAGPLILLVALVGVTYAFFNYTRTGLVNNIGTGRIYFNSTQGNTLYLTNMFPMASSEVSNANLDSITINIVGDTTYNNGQEFEISLVDVNNTIVSGSTEKAIPINYVAAYEATSVATGEDPNVIGTSSNSYFTARGSSTAVYKLNATGTVTEGEQVLIGYIPANVPVNGTLTIKAYLDGSSIAISDTYPSGDITHIESSGETSEEVVDYTDGTNSEWVNGRTVLTTNEWNTLQNTPISFKIKAESNEGTWVIPSQVVINYNANGGTIATSSKLIAGNATVYGDLAIPIAVGEYVFGGWYTESEGGTRVTSTTSFTYGTSPTTLYAHWNTPICKRVTDVTLLHTEICKNTSPIIGGPGDGDYTHCGMDGYIGNNTTITYGNAKELGSELTVGDAFDCKVFASSGSGYYHRAYYVSPYYDTVNETFDNEYATLILASSDTTNTYMYDNTYYNNWHGPTASLSILPPTSAFDNIELKTTSRKIWACSDYNCTTKELTTGNKTNTITPNPFSYEGRAARLLTLMELKESGCNILSGKTSYYPPQSLSACNFLLEGTKYADKSRGNDGVWLENPDASSNNLVYYISASGIQVTKAESTNTYSIRSTIDVPVSALLK